MEGIYLLKNSSREFYLVNPSVREMTSLSRKNQTYRISIGDYIDPYRCKGFSFLSGTSEKEVRGRCKPHYPETIMITDIRPEFIEFELTYIQERIGNVFKYRETLHSNALRCGEAYFEPIDK